MARTPPRYYLPMAEPDSGAEDVTTLLRRFQEGDEAVQSQLIAAVYDELKIIAARYMRREGGSHTLQTTALVNEAYLRLVNVKSAQWQDRAHFFAVAARIMRRILVDHARKHIAGKRGGGFDMLPLDEGLVFTPQRSRDMIRLDEALDRLEKTDERVAKVVQLRFFGGLSIEETAEAMRTSPRTVKREWTFGKAWLRNEFAVAGEADSMDLKMGE
jgi:RNA polymerase sigma-70 factor, ECF subfamily